MAIGACVANNSNDWPVKDLSCIDQVQLIEMRIEYMNKIIVCIALLMGITSWSAHHEKASYISDIGEANAHAVFMCKFNEGFGFAHLDALDTKLHAYFDSNETPMFRSRLVPLFNAQESQLDYVVFEADTYEVFGDDWNGYLTTAEGKALEEAMVEVSTCRSMVSPLYPMYRRDAVLTDDERIVTVNWCTRNSSVSRDALAQRHREFRDNMGDSEAIFWGIGWPSLGVRDGTFPGQFYHLLVYPDMRALAKRESRMANDGGWEMRADYNDNFASCSGEIVLSEKVLRRHSG